MAQYISFQEGVTVNGSAILGLVTAIPTGQDIRLEILKKHGINPELNKWYPQQAWLDAFKEIASNIGNHTVFLIGTIMFEKVKGPPADNLEEALRLIDQAYKMNNKGGDVGEYILKEYDEANKTAVMVCRNPYPSEFDRGIITSIVRKFKPKGSIKVDVSLDRTKETRSRGGNSCTFNIAW